MVRCECGRLMWLKSEEKVMKHHDGHRRKIAVSLSLVEFLKFKLDLLDNRTFGEWLADYMKKRGLE